MGQSVATPVIRAYGRAYYRGDGKLAIGIVVEANITNLHELTDHFFRLHWNLEALKKEHPAWSEAYTFEGGSLPNHDKQGVYAFLKGQEITYIGVGSASGSGRYAGHGLGNRFQAYSHVQNDIHTPKDQRLVDAGAIITIGFDGQHAYLAYALEAYLLGRLETIHNINRPGRAATV